MNIESLIIKLCDDYPTQQDLVREIPTIIDDLENEKDVGINVERLQQICNELYISSSTENLIELQVIINEYRNKYDITDPREVINVDNGHGYVQ